MYFVELGGLVLEAEAHVQNFLSFSHVKEIARKLTDLTNRDEGITVRVS